MTWFVTVELALSGERPLGLVVVGTFATGFAVAAWTFWRVRNHEYRAQISSADVRWTEKDEMRVIRFDELDRVELSNALDSPSLYFVLKGGKRISSDTGYPDSEGLFKAVRSRFTGRMLWGDREVPVPATPAR